MIHSLKLGNKLLPNNLIQGPLAGVSCAPFRRLTWRLSRPAYIATEMISSKTLIYQPKFSHQRYIYKDPDEGPVSFQLAANDPNELAEGVKIVTDYGADLIDLNCGCPVKKIRAKGSGSRLLTNTPLLYKLILAMKQNTHLPVSIKIRVEGLNETFHQELCQVIHDAGVDFITVHGRAWTEHFETPCRHDAIQFFVENLKIPVIGNGDVACLQSLKKMFATGCAGVMIGRAGVGQPWLIKKLMAEMNSEVFEIPSWTEIANLLIEHLEHLIKLLGNEKFAIFQMRKLAKYYARGLPNRAEFCEAINQCDNQNHFREICKTYVSEDLTRN